MKIVEPTLLLDIQKCKSNIEKMCHKAKENDLLFRPHFKTHQSLEIGRWFKDHDVKQITVSSLNMAMYFMQEWKDITVAFPTNILEIDKINKIASSIHLNLLIEDLKTIQKLGENSKFNIGIFIKIDVGYHRTGINPTDIKKIDKLLTKLKQYQHLDFKGFLGHAGHSYSAKSQNEILQIHAHSIQCMKELKSHYITEYPNLITSLGDTPTCSTATNFEGVDEIRPGNFVFYDLAQWSLGVCKLEDIAVTMACPIIAKHPERKELVIYGGGVHFSKDVGNIKGSKTPFYGYVTDIKKTGWENIDLNSFYIKMSQEHGIIKADENCFEKYNVGDVIGVIPIHSCMTADLFDQYITSEGRIMRL